MDALVGSKLMISFTNLGIEILIVAATELVFRALRANAKLPETVGTCCQGAILLLTAILLALHHHVPYILCLLASLLLGRLIFGYYSRWKNDQSSEGTKYYIHTKPLLGQSKPSYPHYTHHDYWNNTYSPTSLSLPSEAKHLSRAEANHFSRPQVNYFNRDHFSTEERFHRPTLGLLQRKSLRASQWRNQVPRTTLGVPVSNVNQPIVKKSGFTATSLSPTQRNPVSDRPQPLLSTADQEAYPTPTRKSVHSVSSAIASLGDVVSTWALRPSKTPPGLINTGNMCFINSVLQCLNWTPGFVELVNDIRSKDVSSPVVLKLRELLGHCHVVPDGVKRFGAIDTSVLLNALFQVVPHLVVADRPQPQQDAAEFLLWLLDYLHHVLTNKTPRLSDEEVHALSAEKKSMVSDFEQINANVDVASCKKCLVPLAELDWRLNRNKNSSSIYDLFLGQVLEARQCQLCKKNTANLEYYTVLPLPVPSQTGSARQVFHLEECFQLFTKIEQLDKTNMLACSCVSLPTGELNLVPGIRFSVLSTLPKTLLLLLTRYSYNSQRRMALKNTAAISIPLLLELQPFTLAGKVGTAHQGCCTYSLKALCIHCGAQTTSFGHYTAYSCTEDGKWYHFNDNIVSAVHDIQLELNSTCVQENAYILFYTATST